MLCVHVHDHDLFDILVDMSSKNNTKSKCQTIHVWMLNIEVLFEIACCIKSILQSDFNEIEQLKKQHVCCIVQYLQQKDVCFAVQFWEVNNFSDDTKCAYCCLDLINLAFLRITIMYIFKKHCK